MLLLKHGVRTADPFLWPGADDPLPSNDTPVIVPLRRWQADRDGLRARTGPVGVLLAAGEPVEALAEDLPRLAVVALAFPKFTDGRNYSAARLLRERYGYGGEIRAVGNVLRDQFQFMVRCGIDAVVLDADHPSLADPEAAWQAAVAEVGVWYQRTGDGRPVVWQQRQAAAVPG